MRVRPWGGVYSYFSKQSYNEYDKYAEVDIDYTKSAKNIIIIKNRIESQKIYTDGFQAIEWDQSFEFKNQLKEMGFIESASNTDEYGVYKLLKSRAYTNVYIKYYEQKIESKGKMYNWYELRFYLN